MRISVNGNAPLTWAEFLDLNSFELADALRIEAALKERGEYTGGGGTGAEYTLRVVMRDGTRVRLTQPVDNFPTGYFEAGLTGTLVRIDDENSYWVRLDKHFDELNEWNNELQIWDWSEDGACPQYAPPASLEAIEQVAA